MKAGSLSQDQKNISCCTRLTNRLSFYALQCATTSAYCYYIAKTFTLVNPRHAIPMGLASTTTERIVSPIYKAIFNREGANCASRVVGHTATLLTGIAASFAAANLLDYPVTPQDATYLALAQVAGAVTIVLASLPCAVLAGAAKTSKQE